MGHYKSNVRDLEFNLFELFEAEDLFAWQKRHVFGHAVHAAEITAVSNRQSQVIDFAGEAIVQGALRGVHQGYQ